MSLDLGPALEHPFTGIDAAAVADLGALTTGKVRDIVDLGDTLALIATDRISAFDHVLGWQRPSGPEGGSGLPLFEAFVAAAR